jgi:hypothetical protein
MNHTTEEYLEYLNFTTLNETQIIESVNKFLTENKINESTLIKSYKTNIVAVEKFLTKYKVDIGYIKSEAKKTLSYIKSQQEKGADPKVVAKTITDKLAKKIINKVKVNTGLSISEKLLTSIILFSCVYFVNTFLHGLAGAFLSPMAALLFLACIVAPLTEEYAKRLALLNDFPFLYTGLFAGAEAIIYISALTAAGMPLVTAIITRAIAWMFHMTTVYVQKSYHDKAIEEQDEDKSKMGFYIALAMHSLWNFTSIAASA